MLRTQKLEPSFDDGDEWINKDDKEVRTISGWYWFLQNYDNLSNPSDLEKERETEKDIVIAKKSTNSVDYDVLENMSLIGATTSLIILSIGVTMQELFYMVAGVGFTLMFILGYHDAKKLQ